MTKSKSSTRWLQEHFGDKYVERAQREGYRSRAVYKLQELDEREALFQAGMTVVDLGAAPGGWSQYVSERLAGNGAVIACDILPMDTLPGVVFIEGDFTESAVLDKVLTAMDRRRADIVISDMAPNMSGVDVVDQARSVYLVELALVLAQQVLKPGGTLLVKLFQGEGFDDCLQQLRQAFSRVYSRKPKASRPRSREVYILARGMKL